MVLAHTVQYKIRSLKIVIAWNQMGQGLDQYPDCGSGLGAFGTELSVLLAVFSIVVMIEKDMIYAQSPSIKNHA